MTAGLNVAEGVLAHGPQIEAALDEVRARAPGHRVHELERVGDALLGVVVFLPQRRVAGDSDEAQSPIARVRRQLRQADLAVDADALPFLVHLIGDARVAEARLVQQARRDHAHARRHQVLRSPVQRVAISGQERKPGPGERLEQRAVRVAVARRQIQPAARRPIDADVELVVPILEIGRGHEVGQRRVAVRERVQRRDRLTDWVLEERRHLVARKRLPGEEVDGRGQHAVREITGPLGRRGHVGHLGDALGGARALVVGEEEQPVAADGPAHRPAKLVAAVVRGRLVARREEIPRVERSVAEEAVAGSVKAVGARLQHDVHLAGAVSPDLGLVAARQDLELADRVNRRPHGRRVQLRIDVVHAVEKKAVGVFAASGRSEGEIAAHRACRSLSGRGRAWHQQRQLEKVASVERQVHDLRVFHDRANRRRVALERDRRCRDDDLLGRRTDLKRHIQPKVLADKQLELLDVGLESRPGHLEPVRPGRQRTEHVLAVAGGLDATDEVCVAVGYRSFDPAGQRARRIADDATHGGRGRLGCQRRGQKDEKRERQESGHNETDQPGSCRVGSGSAEWPGCCPSPIANSIRRFGVFRYLVSQAGLEPNPAFKSSRVHRFTGSGSEVALHLDVCPKICSARQRSAASASHGNTNGRLTRSS